MFFDPNQIRISDVSQKTLGGKTTIAKLVDEYAKPLTIMNDLPIVMASEKDRDVGTFLEGWEYNKHSQPTDLDHGPKPTKTGSYSRVDGIGYREGSLQYRKKHKDYGGRQFDEVVNQEIMTKMHNLSLDAEHDIFYGDIRVNPELYMGIYPRFSMITDEYGVIKNGEYSGMLSPYTTLDAGGTSSGALCSVIGLVPGEDACRIIYPKDSASAGFMYDPAPQWDTVKDENGGDVRQKTDLFSVQHGFSMLNRQAGIRIANIDYTTDDGLKKLETCLYQAGDIVSKDMLPRMIFYVPQFFASKIKAFYNNGKTAVTYEGAKPQNISGDFEIPGLGYFRPVVHMTLAEDKVV